MLGGGLRSLSAFLVFCCENWHTAYSALGNVHVIFVFFCTSLCYLATVGTHCITD